MDTSGISGGQTAQSYAVSSVQQETKNLYEMMRDAREKADARREQYKLPKNTRYGDAPMLAYARLARARTPGEVSAASGYARRKIVQLQSALRSDPDNKERIQAAIRSCKSRPPGGEETKRHTAGEAGGGPAEKGAGGEGAPEGPPAAAGTLPHPGAAEHSGIWLYPGG